MVKLNCLKSVPFLWRIAAAASLLFMVIALALYLWAAAFPVFPPHYANKDFSNYWAAGQLLRSGDALVLFGPQPDYFRHLILFFGPDYSWHAWSYPPHFLLALWPFGYLSYETGLLSFLFLTGAFYAWGIWKFSGRAFPMAIAAALPFAVHNVQSAQNGFLTAGLVLGALALREARPVAAGILLGLLTIKPQLGFLFPVLLLAERNWTMIATAALTAAAMFAASVFFYGIDTWQGFFTHIAPYQMEVMLAFQGLFVSMFTSFFGYFRLIGMDGDSALFAHAFVAFPAAAFAAFGFWRFKSSSSRGVTLIIATLLISPYAFSYDFGAAAVAAGLLAARAQPSGRLREIFLIVAASCPAVMIAAAEIYLPLVQCALLGMLFLVFLDEGWLRPPQGQEPEEVAPQALSPGASSD